MEKKIKALSWSEFWLYINRPDDYYSEYVLGIKGEPSRPMILGNIIHEAIEGKTDWREQLKKHNFTSDKERMIEDVLKYQFPQMEHEQWLGEYGKHYEETDSGIVFRADGISKPPANILYEVKSSESFWTQEKADTHGQITLGDFIWKKLYGVIPTNIIFSINTKNGKVKKLETKRSEYQINEFITQVRQMVQELKNKDWWMKRVSTYRK